MSAFSLCVPIILSFHLLSKTDGVTGFVSNIILPMLFWCARYRQCIPGGFWQNLFSQARILLLEITYIEYWLSYTFLFCSEKVHWKLKCIQQADWKITMETQVPRKYLCGIIAQRTPKVSLFLWIDVTEVDKRFYHTISSNVLWYYIQNFDLQLNRCEFEFIPWTIEVSPKPFTVKNV